LNFAQKSLYLCGQNKETVMSKYQHTKGEIRDNAIQALLHDPLFRQRIEQKQKGKGSYRRKDKHEKRGGWEASDKKSAYHWPSALWA